MSDDNYVESIKDLCKKYPNIQIGFKENINGLDCIVCYDTKFKKDEEMEEIRLCVFCKQFRIHPEHPDYSDLTPGNDYEEYCAIGEWDIDDIKDENHYRETIALAKMCNKFEFFKS